MCKQHVTHTITFNIPTACIILTPNFAEEEEEAQIGLR